MNADKRTSARRAGGESKSSLAREVYDKILAKLVNNELAPGDLLKRREVAAELGVSVAPVLEAFLQLEMEGYVEAIPRKGTIIKAVKQDDVYEQLIMREAIECEAARFYCGAPVSRDYERLGELARKLDETPADFVGHWQYEIDFHGALVALSGLRVLVSEFHHAIRLGTFYSMHRVFVEMRQSGEENENQSHSQLLEKLLSPDPDNVERVIRDHLRSGKRRLFMRG